MTRKIFAMAVLSVPLAAAAAVGAVTGAVGAALGDVARIGRVPLASV